MTYDSSQQTEQKPSYESTHNYGVSSIEMSDKINLDLCEIMNGLYDEQTNMLSILDPSSCLEGGCLFYKNQLVQNQLDHQYLQAVNRVCLLYDLFEGDNSRAEKGIAEVVQVNSKGLLYTNLGKHLLLGNFVTK